MSPLTVLKINRVVPYTFSILDEKFLPTSNMNSEYTGIEVKALADDQHTIIETVILLPTRGENRCEGIDLLIDLING